MDNLDQMNHGKEQNGAIDNDMEGMATMWNGGDRGPVRGRGSFAHPSRNDEPRSVADRIDRPVHNDTSTGNAPRVKSLVVSMDEAEDGFNKNGNIGSKRPAGDAHLDQRPDMKKRNKRLFGSLLGTLKKAREEEDRIQGTDAAQRRAAALREAERKSHEASTAAQAAAVAAGGQYTREPSHPLARREGRDKVHTGNREEWQHKLIDDALLLSTVTKPVVRWAPRIECEEVIRLREKQHQEVLAETTNG